MAAFGHQQHFQPLLQESIGWTGHRESWGAQGTSLVSFTVVPHPGRLYLVTLGAEARVNGDSLSGRVST